MTTEPSNATALVDAVATVGGWTALAAGAAAAAGTTVASLHRLLAGRTGRAGRQRAWCTADRWTGDRSPAWRRLMGTTAGLLTAAVGAAATGSAPPAGATAESGATLNHTTISGGAPEIQLLDVGPDADRGPGATDPTGTSAAAPTAAPTTASTTTPSTITVPSIPVPTTPEPAVPGPMVAPVPAARVPAAPPADRPSADLATPPTTPADPTTPAAPVTTVHRVADGEHFWSIATEQLRARLGRTPGDDEIVRYWLALIEANRDRLADPADPDLIHPGLELLLPEVGPVT
jgi:LysM repeat protein